MKVGDLVKCKPGRAIAAPVHHVGIILYTEQYDETGIWYCVQWHDDFLWHYEGDLELINES